VRKMFLVAALIGGSIPVLGQEEVDTVPTYADSVVVTASLEEESKAKLPASVDVIESDEIEERQATEVADLLATVPGLTLTRSGGPGQVTSLFSRGTESDHTLVLWNGVELNNPFFGGFDWAFLPTQGVKRVEIARGPFSAIHGSDAIGGVVQVLTDSMEGGSLRLESGDRGYFRGTLAVGTSTPGFEVEVLGHVRTGDGVLDNDFYDSEEAVARAEWDIGGGMSLGVTARVNQSDVGIPLSGGQPSPSRRISWKEQELALPFHIERGEWRVDVHVSQVIYQTDFRDPADAFGFTRSDTESEALRLRTSATRSLTDKGWFAFGAEVERLEVDDRSVFGVNLSGARQQTRAAFGEIFRTLGRVHVDLGLRYDDNDAFGSKTSPRLGLSADIGRRGRVKVSFGEGFRAPSLGELFFPASGNSELLPEESESFELGVEWVGQKWTLGVTGFQNRLTNLIDFDFVSFSNINLGRAKTEGLEAWTSFQVPALRLRWNMTLLDAVDELNGLPLLRRPRESSSLLVSLPGKRMGLHLTGRYVARRPDVDPVTFARSENPGYVRFDLAAHWKRSGRLTPYARIENLADREYAEALGFPAPGRTVVVGLLTDWP